MEFVVLVMTILALTIVELPMAMVRVVCLIAVELRVVMIRLVMELVGHATTMRLAWTCVVLRMAIALHA